ncbi:MAG: YeeE/YedE family protein [Cyclobacteriaceae bacterium]|nr:YeeE/YedE family protein [Cyclobacteriaceae bacterium]
MNIVELIKNPWPWYIGGPMITLIMFVLLYFGKNFGVSANLRTMCTIGGAGKFSDFFRFNWKSQLWNIVFVLGTVIGGYISNTYLSSNEGISLSTEIIAELKAMGIQNPGDSYFPSDLFSWDSLFSLRGLILLVGGGFLIGFGARYAGGCTSGHAISGLSDLQIPSLIAVVGFFIGGLLMTYLFLPHILTI